MGAALPILLLLFVGSGLSALIYEVVWFQLLELVIGSSAISLGLLLTTYMGGMCIGSLALPRFAAKTRHPLRLYGWLELCIGAFGLLELFVIPLVGRLYSPVFGHGAGAIALRAVVAGLCLLPPTVLMGATLPAIARWVEASPRGMSWLGFFYGGNIAGAVAGSVLAGFYLLRVYDQAVATYVGVAVNVVVGALAVLVAGRGAARTAPTGDAASRVDARHASSGEGSARVANAYGVPSSPVMLGDDRVVYLAIALSGACALGAEVVWTRLLSLTFGASVYTFSMILAVFLAGLGIGSAGGSWVGRVVERPRVVLAWCQGLLMLALAWAAAVIYAALPNWPINPSLAPSAWYALQMDLARCAVAVLPGAVLWGASFPLALASLTAPGSDPSRTVSRVYAANTIGSIVGAVLCSLVLVPMLGTQGAQRVLIALSALSVLMLMITPAVRSASSSRASSSGASSSRMTWSRVAWLVPPVLAGLLIAVLPKLPGELVAHGRYTVTWLGKTDVLYVGEGMNSSVAVTRVMSSGATQFHVAGKVEASSLPQDMRLQKMLAHLPALVHPNPQRVLVVGFGAGVTAGSFLPYPSVNRLVICEMEPLVPQVVSTWFTKENNGVATDPRTHITFDDARSFVQTTDEQFDVITSDPINPWVKGAASLYTREYFEAVKRHLAPGGVVTQWVPLYESTLDAVRSELRTFFEVFPNGTVWANLMDGRGYDVVLMGTNGPTTIDLHQMQQRFAQAGYDKVASSLMESGFDSPTALFATYFGDGPALKGWLSDAAINTDRNLRLQYLAGVGLNSYTSAEISDAISKYRTFPEGLFAADPEWTAQLRRTMGIP